MGFQNNAHAFAHYTYDVVNAGAGNRRDNEHLTIENSLVTLIAVLARDPEGVWKYMGKRSEMWKPEHEEYAKAYGYSGTDNLNFRPARNNQVSRGLPAGRLPDGVVPKGAASGALDVEADFTLRNFLDFVQRVFARLGYADAQDVRTSIETVVGWTSRTQDTLYLNSSQRSDFAAFVLTALDAVAAHDRAVAGQDDPPQRYGGPLGSLTEPTPRITLTAVPIPAVMERLSPELQAEIGAAVGSTAGKWERIQGDPSFNEVRTAIIAQNWNAMKNLARTKPTVAAPVLAGAAL
jgi:hypothetical protein